MTEKQEWAITWVEETLQGHRRGKGELEVLKTLLDIINEQFVEIEFLKGGKP